MPEYIEHLKTVLHEEKATISNIILTHWHHDHIGGVGDVLGALATDNGRVVANFLVKIYSHLSVIIAKIFPSRLSYMEVPANGSPGRLSRNSIKHQAEFTY